MENEEENNEIKEKEVKEEKEDTNTVIIENNVTNYEETERSPSFGSIDIKEENDNDNINIKKIKVNITKNEEIIISILLYLIIGCVTILIPKLKSMFNLVGCTAANCIQFIIPCLMVICLKDKAEKLINLLFVKILLGFGIISLVICLIAEIVHNFL